MPASDLDDDSYLKPHDMAEWMAQEIRDVSKASELRIADATSFATQYALGTITREDADRRLQEYVARWGDALPGVHCSSEMTNEEILTAIDANKNTDWGNKTREHRGDIRGR